MKTLKIDCDWVPPREYVAEYVCRVIPLVLGNDLKKVKIKRSRRNLHFIITLNKHVDDDTVCKLQFLLGDDRNRCKMNYQRLIAGMKNGEWNKLFVWSQNRKRLLG
jgi:hypothetical protein